MFLKIGRKQNRKVFECQTPKKEGFFMMRKSLLCLLLLGAASTALASSGCCGSSGDCDSCSPSCIDDCTCEASSQTYFAVRPQYQSASPELVAGFRNERIHAANRDNGWAGGALEVAPFGGRSTKPGHLASYFMPNCKNSLVVDSRLRPLESDLPAADLLAEH